MTRRSSGFSTEGKCFIVLIRGKARIRHAGLFTRVMLSSFSHSSQVMTSTLMSIVPGLAVAISITAPGAGSRSRRLRFGRARLLRPSASM